MQRRWQDVRVISFHTDDENYTREARRLERSIKQFPDLPYTIQTIPAGPWKSICHQKPQILLGLAEQFPDVPLLFVDADAVFEQDPREILPNTWIEREHVPALSVHILRKRLCSGTIIMPPGKARLQALKKWIDADRRRRHLFSEPQRILRDVGDMVCSELDPQWCWIFDISPKAFPDVNHDPIITHLQASRDYRYDQESNEVFVQNRRRILKERFGE
jgi:hypothetical protein